MSSTPTIFTFYNQDPIISYETILTKDLYDYNTDTLIIVTVGTIVTDISENCFKDCYNLESVTFDDNSNLESIGESSFRDADKIETINIPKNVKTIGDYCFYNCLKLTSVTFDDNSIIESFGEWCFSNVPIESIIIPNSVRTIDYACFYGCVKLSSIYFQDNSIIEYIGQSCFFNCIALHSITIPTKVNLLLDNVCFAQCTALKTVTYLNPGNITIGNAIYGGITTPMVVYFCNTSEIPVDEPDTVYDSSIYPNGSALIPVDGTSTIFTFFSDNTYTYKNSSENILSQSSYDNKTTTLKSVIVGSEVIAFADNCFQYCTSLTTIDFQYSTTKLESFGAYCFDGCTLIQDIMTPTTVKTLYEACFAHCGLLVDVHIGNNTQITELPDLCFFSCYALNSINIPSNVTSIGEDCFYKCTALNSITIPYYVTYLGNLCFAECTALNTVTYLNPANITIGGYNIFNKDNPMTVYFYKTITIPDDEPDTVYNSTIYPTGSAFTAIPPGDGITTGSELITFMNDTAVPNCYIFNPIAIDSELLSASSKSLFATKSDVTIVRNVI